MIKLPVNETKWSSLLARTHALILYISIWIFDFGPVKLPGLSRNGPQEPMPPNLTDELSAEKERRLNQFGTPILVWCGKSVKFDSLSSFCRTLLRLHTRCAFWIRCRVSVAPTSNLFNTVRHVNSKASEPGLRRNCPTSSSKIKCPHQKLSGLSLISTERETEFMSSYERWECQWIGTELASPWIL